MGRHYLDTKEVNGTQRHGGGQGINAGPMKRIDGVSTSTWNVGTQASWRDVESLDTLRRNTQEVRPAV